MSSLLGSFQTYNYNEIGNITYKSDVGDYEYLKAHQVKTAGTNNYTYDKNGNVIKKNNTTIEYNSNNKPTQLKNQTTTTQFFYNPNKQRYKKILNGNTTFYIGKHYEEEYTQNNTLLKKNYIYAGNELIAIHTTEDDGNLILPQNRYLHKDSLGSIDTITNESGVVIQRLAYTPFGKQIVQSWINQNQSIKPLVKRGYTGHEHIKEFNLIHMNARIYDPTIGRFLSADTIIPYMYNTQSFNRYSYVRNNPLKYIDPSGHWGFSSFTRVFKKIVKNTHTLFKKIDVGARILYSKPVKRFFIKYKWARTVGTMVAAYFGPAAVAVFSAYLTEIQGGSYSDMLKSAVVSYASAYVAYGVAEGTSSLFDISSEAAHSASFLNAGGNYGVATFKAAAHGLSRVAFAKAQGQKTSSAFWSGFVASGFSVGNEGYGGMEARTAIMAIVGGTTSEISGGKFANGAVTGAFIHLYNAENFGQKVMNKAVDIYYNGTRTKNMANIINRGRIGAGVGITTGGIIGGPAGAAAFGVIGTGGGMLYGAVENSLNMKIPINRRELLIEAGKHATQ